MIIKHIICHAELFFKVKTQRGINIRHINKLRIFFPVKKKYAAYIVFVIQVNAHFTFISLYE